MILCCTSMNAQQKMARHNTKEGSKDAKWIVTLHNHFGSIISADCIEIESHEHVVNQEHQLEVEKSLSAGEDKYAGPKASFTKGTNEESDEVEVLYQQPGTVIIRVR